MTSSSFSNIRSNKIQWFKNNITLVKLHHIIKTHPICWIATFYPKEPSRVLTPKPSPITLGNWPRASFCPQTDNGQWAK